MALIIAPKGPTSSLGKALNDFQQILSDREKEQFQAQEKPDVSAVINLTTLIDENCNSRRKRCMGARVTAFLESIRYFSAILSSPVDAFVSSHPEVAALVWGGVKLALLAVNNISSYFEKLSALFMRLGRTCRRLKEYSQLYSSSKDVQTTLCNYYAVVVRVCQYSVVSSRESGSTRLLIASLYSYEIRFGKYEAELLDLFGEVEKAIDLASKQKQDQDSNKITTIWEKILRDQDYSKRSQIEAEDRRSKERRLRVLDSFSTYNSRRWYNQIRKECIPGTSTWLCESDTFQTWMAGHLGILWCCGRLGSGKTVMSASVVNYIEKTKPSKDAAAFFFCRYDDEESLNARTILGSIVRQLAENLSVDAFANYDDKDSDITTITNFLLAKLNKTHRHFIVIDGLDDCEEEQVGQVAESFHRLMESPLHISIYCSSRPIAMSWLPLGFQPQHIINLDLPEYQGRLNCDISQFIEVMLEELTEGERPKLKVNDQQLIDEIRQRLRTEAQGMFLWVKLQILTLCDKKSDSKIRAALDNLPRSLPEIFERILRQFKSSDEVDLGSQIFRWIAVVKRPLTIEELRGALATKPLQKEWKDEQVINDMDDAMACCGNLIFVDEEHQTIHFTHGSVKQHLTSHDAQRSLEKYYVDPKEANAEIGAICVTYLHFPIVGTQVARAVELSKPFTQVPTKVLSDTFHGNRIASRLVREVRMSSKSLDHVWKEASGDTTARRQQVVLAQYSFRLYAEHFWLEHTNLKIGTDNSKELWSLWCILMARAGWSNNLCGTPWTVEDWENRNANVVRWIVEKNHCSLARLVETPEKTLTNETLLLLIEGAAMRGHTGLVQICLDMEDVPQTTLDSALRAAAGSAHLDIVHQLLSAGADLNAGSRYHRSALQAAAIGGHLNVVELLLAKGADINTAADDFAGRTALQAAAESGHLLMVETLLRHKAEINAAACHSGGRTALQAAAECCHLDVIESLLHAKSYNRDSADADVNAAPGSVKGRTALQAAAGCPRFEAIKKSFQDKYKRTASPEDIETMAQNAYLTVIDRLFEAGAKVNAPAGDAEGRTAIQAAAESGHISVVERLLEKGADVNMESSDNHERTALGAASGRGHLEVVIRLLDYGADANAMPSPNGKTALLAAVDSGDVDVVRRLLQGQATVNMLADGFRTTTPLQAAARNGHLPMVDVLLDWGAEVNYVDDIYPCVSALQAARESGHSIVVDRLLAAGAK